MGGRSSRGTAVRSGVSIMMSRPSAPRASRKPGRGRSPTPARWARSSIHEPVGRRHRLGTWRPYDQPSKPMSRNSSASGPRSPSTGIQRPPRSSTELAGLTRAGLERRTEVRPNRPAATFRPFHHGRPGAAGGCRGDGEGQGTSPTCSTTAMRCTALRISTTTGRSIPGRPSTTTDRFVPRCSWVVGSRTISVDLP